MSEYVASGFIAELGKKSEVRNQLFDLAHRHLEAAGISRQLDGVIEPIDPRAGLARRSENLPFAERRRT